jgi:hypothetical protein
MTDIDQRTGLRAESGLPLLDALAESKRLAAVVKQAAFEQEWQNRRLEFAHQWVSSPRDGWLTNMARYAQARRAVRREMEIASRGGK